MGSVIDVMDCPNCNQPDCHSDFYYKTGEEYIFCSDCGYSRSVTIKNREKSLKDLTDDDWAMEELKNPWGVFKIKEIGMVGWTVGAIASEKEFSDISNNVMEHLESVDEFSLSRFVNGKIERKMIVSSAKIVNEIME